MFLSCESIPERSGLSLARLDTERLKTMWL